MIDVENEKIEELKKLSETQSYKLFLDEYSKISPRFERAPEGIKLLSYYLLTKGQFEDVSKCLPDLIFDKVPVDIKTFIESDKYGAVFNKTLRSTWRKELYDFFKSGSSYEEVVFTGSAGCVDRDTEFFTGKEWKKISEYKKGDKVLQYDTVKGMCSLTYPIKYIKEKCTEFVNFKTNVNEMVLSDDHNVVYCKNHNLNLIKRDTVSNILKNAESNVNRLMNYVIPISAKNGVKSKGASFTDDELRLCIVIQKYCKYNVNNTYVLEVTSPKKMKIIETLFNNTNTQYMEYTTVTGNKKYFLNFRPFKEELYNVSTDQAKFIINEVLNWSGYKHERTEIRYDNDDKKWTDFIQYCCFVSGRYSFLTKGEGNKKESYHLKYSINTRRTTKLFQSKEECKFPNRVPSLDGYKYCFTVPTSTLVFRKNGRIFITGNSGKAQPLYSKIKTQDGWTTMGEIQVGDILDNSKGGTCKVTGVYPQGIKKIYRVYFRDGRFVDCCKEHLWKVSFFTSAYADKYKQNLISTTPVTQGVCDTEYIMQAIKKQGYFNNFYWTFSEIHTPNYTSPDGTVIKGGIITNIEEIGDHEAQCIMVDSYDHLYVTDGYIVTHNTTIARYMILYTLYKLCCLKNPQAVFGLSQESPLSIVFLSTTLDMAKSISLLPFVEILSLCPAFEKVKSINNLYNYTGNKIPFVYTDSDSIIKFKNNIAIEVGSNRRHLVGRNVIASFLDEAELSGNVDDILDLYGEVGQRIRSRFKSSSFTFMSMISSAGMSNGVIAQYLENMKDFINKSIKVCKYAKWELDINIDPYENGSFYVFGGTTIHPSRFLTDEEARIFLDNPETIPPFCDVIRVPIEELVTFKRSVEKGLRDVCGRNTQVSEILFPDLNTLEDRSLCPLIKLESSIKSKTRLSTQLPAHLFMSGHNGKKFLSRFYKEPRYIATDLSLNKGSETAFCMLHKECDDDGGVMYVVDFILSITTPDKIRVECIPELIEDLKYEYNVIIQDLIFDQWQTLAWIQYFEENKVSRKVSKKSTSKNVSTVRLLSNLVAQDKVKVGACGKLKKQLSSLALFPGQDRLTYKNSKTQGIYDLAEVLMNATSAAYDDKYTLPTNDYIKNGKFINPENKIKDKKFINNILDKFNFKI